MTALVHPTATVDPGAEIADNVEIGPYALIEEGVKIAAGCRIAAHAIVRQFSILEEDVSIDSFAVVGGLPQDLSFSGATESSARLGKGTILREGVTVNRSTKEGGVTRVGDNCMLMANSHIAHDCQLGDKVILANNAMLAGHVHVGDGSFLGGGCGIHQFVNIGRLVMVAGNASVTYDVASFLMVAERSTVVGLNLVGLKRHLSSDVISDLRACYKSIYMKAGDPAKLAARVTGRTPEAKHFIQCFATSGKRRFSRSKAQK